MVRYILFDLDNTLYSAKYGIELEVSRRVIIFLSRYLNVTETEAGRLRTLHVPKYGTTAEWLVRDLGLDDINIYYNAIYRDNEAETLRPDPELIAFLESLPVPAAVLTNSPMEHAERILDKLGIREFFTRIFDIRWNRIQGKPQAEAFTRVLDAIGTKAEETLFVDDLPSYVEGFINIGGRGILFDEFDQYHDWKYSKIRHIKDTALFLRESL